MANSNAIRGAIRLRVGTRIFYTTTSILTAQKESFFCGLLSSKFELAYFNSHMEEIEGDTKKVETKKDEGEYFIARDGDIFQYVLEYLIYGQVFSELSKVELNKLLADAKYYLLPDLASIVEKKIDEFTQNELTHDKLKKEIEILKKEHVTDIELLKKELVTIKQETKNRDEKRDIFASAKFGSTSGGSNGSYWQWNLTDQIDSTGTITASNDKITVNKTGTYLIMTRTTNSFSSGNYYMALYRNGNPISYAYDSSNDGNYHNWQINELFTLNASDCLQVYVTCNGSPYASAGCNKFSILLFH